MKYVYVLKYNEDYQSPVSLGFFSDRLLAVEALEEYIAHVGEAERPHLSVEEYELDEFEF